MTTAKWAPILKIAVTFTAALIIYVADQLGVEFDDQDAQLAAQAFIPVLLGYLVPER